MDHWKNHNQNNKKQPRARPATETRPPGQEPRDTGTGKHNTKTQTALRELWRREGLSIRISCILSKNYHSDDRQCVPSGTNPARESHLYNYHQYIHPCHSFRRCETFLSHRHSNRCGHVGHRPSIILSLPVCWP